MAARGRPPFKPTAAQQRTVREMIACGESKARVARALGIDEDTLRKHFADELENGISVQRREAIALLWKSARKGNVTAQKRLEEMTRIAAAASGRLEPGAEPEAQPNAAPARSIRIGKKEERAEAAKTAATGKFAPPAPPKLVVNND